MMLLSLIDPSLLIYKYNDWKTRKSHCLKRFEALLLHRKFTNEYGQKLAVSDNLISLIIQYFPWNENSRDIGELRDLRQFIFPELQRWYKINTVIPGFVDLQNGCIVCEFIEDQCIVDEWKLLLRSCVSNTISCKFILQIATWEVDQFHHHSGLITARIYDNEGGSLVQECQLPLVWDDDSWFNQLNTLDWWPNLERCVELCYNTCLSMRRHRSARKKPTQFSYVEAFLKSLKRYCKSKSLRSSFIEALTKKVYGIHDVGLRDKIYNNGRYFRVSDFWRVHYKLVRNHIILEEFYPHKRRRRK